MEPATEPSASAIVRPPPEVCSPHHDVRVLAERPTHFKLRCCFPAPAALSDYGLSPRHFLSLHMTWRRKHRDVGRCRLLDTCEPWEANWLVKRTQVRSWEKELRGKSVDDACTLAGLLWVAALQNAPKRTFQHPGGAYAAFAVFPSDVWRLLVQFVPTRTLVLSLRGVCRQLRDLVNAVAHNRVSQRLHALDVLLYQWPSAKSLFTWRSHLTYLPNSKAHQARGSMETDKRGVFEALYLEGAYHLLYWQHFELLRAPAHSTHRSLNSLRLLLAAHGDLDGLRRLSPANPRNFRYVVLQLLGFAYRNSLDEFMDTVRSNLGAIPKAKEIDGSLIDGDSYRLFAHLVSLNAHSTRDVIRVSSFRLIAQCRRLSRYHSFQLVAFAGRAVQWLAEQPAAQVNQVGLTYLRNWIALVCGVPSPDRDA